ncbi:hypothetical protein FQZ97_774030 [compost metagenome]
MITADVTHLVGEGGVANRALLIDGDRARRISGYECGRPVEKAARALGVRLRKVVRLALGRQLDTVAVGGSVGAALLVEVEGLATDAPLARPLEAPRTGFIQLVQQVRVGRGLRLLLVAVGRIDGLHETIDLIDSGRAGHERETAQETEPARALCSEAVEEGRRGGRSRQALVQESGRARIRRGCGGRRWCGCRRRGWCRCGRRGRRRQHEATTTAAAAPTSARRQGQQCGRRGGHCSRFEIHGHSLVDSCSGATRTAVRRRRGNPKLRRGQCSRQCQKSLHVCLSGSIGTQ